MDTEGESARRVRISQVKGRSKQTEREVFFLSARFRFPGVKRYVWLFLFCKKGGKKKWMHLSKQSQK
jgi:hypothetical protein